MGLSFKVMIPTDQEGTGNSTGKILSGGRLLPYVSTEEGTVIRKGPFVRSDNSRWLDPVTAPRRDIPRSRKASLTREPTRESEGRKPHGSFANSDSSSLRRELQRFCDPATTQMLSW